MVELACVRSWREPLPLALALSPFVSRVGGAAALFDADAADADALPPRCAACAAALWLVAQVYAPAAGRERALLIYGCAADRKSVV